MARLDVLLRTYKSNQNPPPPNQDPKSQNQIKTQNRIKDLIACRFVSASHDRSPIGPKKNHAEPKKKKKKKPPLPPSDHSHQTHDPWPQSPNHSHRHPTIIGKAHSSAKHREREKRKKWGRKEKDRADRESVKWINKKKKSAWLDAPT